jgi:hypothetical protein
MIPNTQRQWNWARDTAGIWRQGQIYVLYVDLKDGLTDAPPRASQDLANSYESDHRSRYRIISQDMNSGLMIFHPMRPEYFGLHDIIQPGELVAALTPPMLRNLLA